MIFRIDGLAHPQQEVVLTAVPDPPQVGGVTVELEISKQRPKRNVGIVARRATRRASAGKSAPIRRKPGSGSVRTKQGNRQRSHYAEGSERVGKWQVFMIRHEANAMKKTTPKSDEVWYVDSGVSNHMTSHREWFSYMEKPEQPGVV